MKIEKVALIGMGAMGAFFAPNLLKTLGHGNFFVVADGERKKRLETQGVTINEVNYKFNIIKPTEKVKMDLIIVAVKYMQIDQAIQDIKNFVGENTQIMCVMNGVDGENKLIKVFGAEHVVHSYMRISIAMNNGTTSFDPNSGSVNFGEVLNKSLTPRVQAIKALFEQSNIRYMIEEDMERAIWLKFMFNVSGNLTCALLGVPYGAYHVSDSANAIRRKAMEEVVSVATKKGINLSKDDIEAYEPAIKTIPFFNQPSTLQDLESSRKTEVDMFAGRMVELGNELGIETPLCFMFLHGIKVLEEKNDNLFSI